MSFLGALNGGNLLTKWTGDLTPGARISFRAWGKVLYTPKGGDPQDITTELTKYLLSIDYTDNMIGQVDDVTLTLEDRAQLWLSDWYPQRGSKIDITLYMYNRNNLGEGQLEYKLGTFEIDEIEEHMPPATVQIKAISTTFDGSLRGEKKNRTWENISIWKCASDIAKEHNLELEWHCEDNPNLDHVEQSDESDLDFLQKVVKDAGFALKITAEKIIIIDEQMQEKGDAKIMFFHPGTVPLTAPTDAEEMPRKVSKFDAYTLKAKTRDTYKACHVCYQKGKDKEKIEATFTAPDKKDGQTLEVSEQCETVAEAERLAKKKLREQNKDEVTASFSTYGDFIYAAGGLVELKNFGVFDGKYIITKVGLRFGGGFTVSVDMRRCLDGY